jgi:hypothetical protein
MARRRADARDKTIGPVAAAARNVQPQGHEARARDCEMKA